MDVIQSLEELWGSRLEEEVAATTIEPLNCLRCRVATHQLWLDDLVLRPQCPGHDINCLLRTWGAVGLTAPPQHQLLRKLGLV